MQTTTANRAALFDSIRRCFFGKLSGVCQWRMQVHEDAARRALHSLGGLMGQW